MTATTTSLSPLPQISGAVSPKLHYLIIVLTSVVQGIPASPFAPSFSTVQHSKLEYHKKEKKKERKKSNP